MAAKISEHMLNLSEIGEVHIIHNLAALDNTHYFNGLLFVL